MKEKGVGGDSFFYFRKTTLTHSRAWARGRRKTPKQEVREHGSDNGTGS